MKKIKRFGMLTVILILLTGLTGCGKEEEKEEYGKVSAYEICMAVKDSQADFAGGNTETVSLKDSEEIFTALYDSGEITDYVSDFFYIGSAGASSDEVAAAVIKKENNKKKVKEIFQERIALRKEMFTGYAPEEVKKLEKAKVYERGNYIVMIVSDDQAAAKKALERVTKKGYEPEYGEPSPSPTLTPTNTPTPTPDDPFISPITPEVTPGVKEHDVDTPYGAGYENGFNPLIVTAYKAGNRNLLTDPRDKELYDECSRILQETLGGKELTTVQAETEIYRYVVTHIDYDYTHYSVEGNFVNSDNPYGALFRHVGICTGYSSTFNLLCSMVGIECINVDGTSYQVREPHGWNMVKLGPYWYYVDPCWGWNGSGSYHLSYLNVTAQFMTDTEHYWDMSGVPEADSMSYAERKKVGYGDVTEPFDDPEQVKIRVPKTE